MKWFKIGTLLGAPLFAQALKVGDAVPSTLTAQDENSQTIRFADLKGQWVVLYFYPHDDTPGCTNQAKEFSRLLDEFHKIGAQVYGLSTQGAESHKRFRQKYQLKVPLLTDKDGQVAKAFGVKVFAGMCSRDVVILSPEGKVALIRQGVSPENSPSEILAWLKAQQGK
jgi:peroxiredoxin Q/BCP